MKIIENKDGVASGKIYNIGNPTNNFSVRELAHKMLKLANEFPEYSETAKKVQLVETSSGAYYGNGYQDVQNRVPKIDNTMQELDWAPQATMDDALRKIFEAYRGHVGEARKLVEQS
jgi:nucleoside-diphosphate-sugar epimerase